MYTYPYKESNKKEPNGSFFQIGSLAVHTLEERLIIFRR